MLRLLAGQDARHLRPSPVLLPLKIAEHDVCVKYGLCDAVAARAERA